MVRGLAIVSSYIDTRIKAYDFDIDISKDTLSMSIWLAAGSLTILGFTIIYADKFDPGYLMSNFYWLGKPLFWLSQITLILSMITSGKVYMNTNYTLLYLRKQKTIQLSRLFAFLKDKHDFELGNDKDGKPKFRPLLNSENDEVYTNELMHILQNNGYMNAYILLTLVSEAVELPGKFADNQKLLKKQQIFTLVSLGIILILSIKFKAK